ncbi:MAG: hypothetical protein QM766_17790 [Burkholderiaceae bacterium]
MYFSQTYLGFEANRAKVYVYFISEPYMSNRQRDLHDVFIKRARELGLSTDERVAVLLPIPGYEDAMVKELQDSPHSPIQEFYAARIRDLMPGLIVSRAPIDTKKGIKSAVFFTFNTEEHPFKAAKKLMQEIANAPEDGVFLKFLASLNEFATLKPNFHGVGVDLNGLIEAYIKNSRSRGRNAV